MSCCLFCSDYMTVDGLCTLHAASNLILIANFSVDTLIVTT